LLHDFVRRLTHWQS